MKRAEQEAMNKEAMQIFRKAMNEATFQDLNKSRQLRSCQASVIETKNYYILLSYQTYIAAIDKRTDTLADVLRAVYGYTATSAQHISKFEKDYCTGKWNCAHRLTAR